jgi:hypothetical protein
MNKRQLKIEIQRYIDFGYSIEKACQQVDKLYHSQYTFKVYEIQQQLLNDK